MTTGERGGGSSREEEYTDWGEEKVGARRGRGRTKRWHKGFDDEESGFVKRRL